MNDDDKTRAAGAKWREQDKNKTKPRENVNEPKK